MRYVEKRYDSWQEFESFECPKFDDLNRAIDDLVDEHFLQEAAACEDDDGFCFDTHEWE